MKNYGNVDSKFRFVIVAAKRAKQLLKGSKPKLKTKSKNAIRIAQSEVKSGLVDFKILKSLKDESVEQEETVILGEDLGVADVDIVEEDDVKLPKILLEGEAEADVEEGEEEEEPEVHDEDAGVVVDKDLEIDIDEIVAEENKEDES